MSLLSLLPDGLRALQAPPSRPDRVIVYGRHPSEWVDALRPEAAVWRDLPQLSEVRLARTTYDLLRIGHEGGRQSLVIPMRERNALRMPRLYWGLVPSHNALRAFGNKASFARFVAEEGLADLAPASYAHADAAVFPCVLKLLDMAAGVGVAIVHTVAELERRLTESPWRGRPYLLQACVEGRNDVVTHTVCRGGRVLWHRSYIYELDGSRIQTPASIVVRHRHEAAPATIATLERFLLPLAYDGPASFDYRHPPGRGIVVFEINPRLGGSLMRPDNLGDLGEALANLVANAIPPRPFGRRD